MPAGKVDLFADQGATFEHIITLKVDDVPIEIPVGDSFRGKVRKLLSDPTAVCDITCTVLNQTTNTGQVRLLITDEVTATFDLKPQKTSKRELEDWCYDVEWVKADGSVVRVIEGLFRVSPEVTK